jgi:hypothetical protein
LRTGSNGEKVFVAVVYIIGGVYVVVTVLAVMARLAAAVIAR